MPWRKQLEARLTAPVAALMRGLKREEARRLEEIRIWLDRPIELVSGGEIRQCACILSRNEMEELVAALTGYARYAFEAQMAQGFIPLPGGHRAGICGRIAGEDGHAVRMGEVTSICIRIARQVDGASEGFRQLLIDDSGCPRRVLLLGPPGCGKTTALRDAARYMSDACQYHVAAVDERDELFPQGSTLPLRLDVLRGISKAEGMMLLVRNMAPQVIIVDELGREADVQAVQEIARCGTGLLASVHGRRLEDLHSRPMLRSLLSSGAWDSVVELGMHASCRRIWDADCRVLNKEEMVFELGCRSHGADRFERGGLCAR